MGFAALATIVVVLGVLAALVLTRWSPDAVLLAGVVVLMVLGVLTPEQALSGFANTGMLTVAALFVVAAGLRDTGAVLRIATNVLGRPRTVQGALLRLVPPVIASSAFLNNTPIVAALMPAVADWARRNRIAASKLLLPLAFAATLGGMCTLIGTSTNLVVAGLVAEAAPTTPGLDALSMFDVTAVGLPVAIAGGLVLIGLGPWLLPDRRPAISLADDPREYTVELVVQPDSPLVGRSIEAAGLRHLPGAFLMELDRGERVLAAVRPEERLQAGDRLVFVGILESVVDLQRLPGLTPADDQAFKLDAPREQRTLVEAVVSESNPLRGLSIREGGFRSAYDAVVIAVARHGERLRDVKIGDIVLQPGDTLLLEAHPDFLAIQRDRRDFYLVSAIEGSTPLRHERAGVAVVILGAMVALAAFEILDMLEAAFLAAGAMIATGCVTVTDARRSVDWSVLVAIASAFGIGRALQVAGVDVAMAETLLRVGGDNPLLALIAIYVVGVLMTELLTNNAAAILVFPFALSTAEALEVSPMPFVIALMVAASAGFLTPIGYQTNLMVYGPGGYRFSDYPRLGLPLSIVAGVITIAVVPIFWPF